MTPIWRFNVTLAILTLPCWAESRHYLQWRGIKRQLLPQCRTHAENIGEIADFQGNVTDLTDYNTYRIYLNTEGPLDKLSAVYGDNSRR